MHANKVFEFKFGLREGRSVLPPRKKGFEGSLTNQSLMQARKLPIFKLKIPKRNRKPTLVELHAKEEAKLLDPTPNRIIHKKSASMHDSTVRLKLPPRMLRNTSFLDLVEPQSNLNVSKLSSYVPSSHVFTKLNTRISVKKLEPIEFLPYCKTTKHMRRSRLTPEIQVVGY